MEMLSGGMNSCYLLVKQATNENVLNTKSGTPLYHHWLLWLCYLNNTMYDAECSVLCGILVELLYLKEATYCIGENTENDKLQIVNSSPQSLQLGVYIKG